MKLLAWLNQINWNFRTPIQVYKLWANYDEKSKSNAIWCLRWGVKALCNRLYLISMCIVDTASTTSLSLIKFFFHVSFFVWFIVNCISPMQWCMQTFECKQMGVRCIDLKSLMCSQIKNNLPYLIRRVCTGVLAVKHEYQLTDNTVWVCKCVRKWEQFHFN